MKTLYLVAGLAAALATSARPAVAAPFPVVACNAAPDGATHAWSAHATAATSQLESSLTCPSGQPDPYSSLRNGLSTADVVNAWAEAGPHSGYAEWRFVAPSGTRIVAAAITRDIGNRDEWTPYGRIDGRDQPGESCVRGMNQSFCRIQGTRTFTNLNATTIAYGIRCVTAPYCAHGATLRSVWVLILGATVTLDDRQVPTVSSLDVSAVGGGGWWNRGGTISFSATDNTGIRRRRVVVDGVARVLVDAPGASAGGCGEVGRGVAYSYSRPCADARGLNGLRSIAVSPCGWGDGTHSVRGGAVDTGGLETPTASATVRVDCTPPEVAMQEPSAEVVEGELVEPPVLEASDATSGVASTALEMSVDGGPWEPAGDSVIAEAGRTYVFRAQALDAAGNPSGWRNSPPVVGIARPLPPEPEPVPEPPAEPDEQASGDADVEPVPPAARPEDHAAMPAAPLEIPDLSQPTRTAPIQHLADARLRIASVVAGRRRVVVVGTAAQGLRTIARVTLTAGRTTRTRRAGVRDGAWRAAFRIRRGTRPRRIAIRTSATPAHRRGADIWRARKAPRAGQPLR